MDPCDHGDSADCILPRGSAISRHVIEAQISADNIARSMRISKVEP